eukprot:XP_015578268.2 (+)-neomenthol dehydrogenase isoform X2 [Ricinus communis]
MPWPMAILSVSHNKFNPPRSPFNFICHPLSLSLFFFFLSTLYKYPSLNSLLYQYSNTLSSSPSSLLLQQQKKERKKIMEAKEQDLSSPISSATRWWSKDTVAIVTGANKGIGFWLVKQLAEEGVTVILTARDVERGCKAVEQLRDHHGLNVHFYQLDVSNPSSIKAFSSQFEKEFGVLDILVNNAAVSFNDIHENTVEHAETVIKTNFYGPKLLIQSLFPMFRRSKSISRILNISSRLGSINMKNPKMKEMLLSESLSEEQIDGMVTSFLESVNNGTWKSQGWPEIWTDYAVSKLALNSYSRVLARRCNKEYGLSVNCFCPGFTQTSMTKGKGTHTAHDAAEVGARLALLPPQHLPTGTFYIGFSPGIVSKL